ncbi:MAG TPA: MoaD/ThiS family protein [Actinocrinis sp.]|nr:MoaD/ThiS family protein [Actinocrinis sp.]
MSVTVLVPSALAAFAGGRREVELGPAGGPGTTVAEVFDRLADELPALERRLRDERAAIRRHVNVYVDGTDIRDLSGPGTAVPDGATVQVIAAVSGG